MTRAHELVTNTLAASKAWRISNLYTIRNKDGALEAFKPNPPQRLFYNAYWFCNHVLKARKLGFSTFIANLFLDDLLITPTGLRCGIIDYTITDAEEKLAMMVTAYDNLDNPELHPGTYQLGRAIKRAVPILQQSSRKLRFANGSSAMCSTSLRGSTPQRLLVSELGKTAIWAPIKAREIVNGAFNALPPGAVRNIESTHEGGKAGIHFRLLDQALKLVGKPLSPLQSRFHFFGWFLDPMYQLPAGKLRPVMVEYFAKLETQGILLTPEQKTWYDQKQQEQGHAMKKEFPSTPGEAFEAIAEGAIYGTEMADLRAAGRVCDFGPEAGLPLFTFWDIGLSDFTAIWLIQPVKRWFLVLDWFEAEGKPGTAMPEVVAMWEARWRRTIAGHYLPHDADTRDPGTGLSYAATLRHAGLRNVRIVPRTPDIWLGIGAVRDILPHCWFNQDRADRARAADGDILAQDDTRESYPSGVACLEGYSKDTGAAAGMRLREMPKHDLFSHSADAFRTFAEAHRRNLIALYEDHQTATRPIAKGKPNRSR